MVQVYLNGELVELSGQQFALNISNSALSNLSQRATTHTNSFRLPKSTTNLNLLSAVGLLGSNNEITNSNIPARIDSGGITILEHGIANIVAIDSEYIDIEIYSSVRNLGDVLSQKKLTDLDYPATSHELNIQQIENANRRPNSPFIYANINFRAEGGGDEPFVPYMLPCIREQWIFEQIFEQNGFTFEGQIPNEDVVIGPSRGLDINIGPKPERQFQATPTAGIEGSNFGGLEVGLQRDGGQARSSSNIVSAATSAFNFVFDYDGGNSTASIDAPDIVASGDGLRLSDNIIFISLGSVDLPALGRYIVSIEDSSDLAVAQADRSLGLNGPEDVFGVRTNLIVVKRGDTAVGFHFFENESDTPYILSDSGTGYTIEFYNVLQLYTEGFSIAGGITTTYDLTEIVSEGDTRIQYAINRVANSGARDIPSQKHLFRLTGQFGAKLVELDPLPKIELQDIVPDISQLQFVKEVLWRYGLLLSPTADDRAYSIEFIDRVVKSEIGTIDWSDKYLGFEEKIYQSEFGQENNFSYKSYTDYSGYADGNFEISSGLAEPVKQVISSQYEFREKEERRFRLGVYGEISNGFPRKNRLSANIFRLNSLDLIEVKIDDFNTVRLDLWDLTHNYLAWSQMVLLYYDGLRQVGEVNEAIRANFNLNAGDIRDLDLYKTVYVEQLGGKFYISRIENYTSDAPATIVELTKLPDEFTPIPDIPLLNESTGISAIIADCILNITINPANIVSAASNSTHTINFQVGVQENIRYFLYGVYFTGQAVLSATLNPETGTGSIIVKCSVNNDKLAEINTLQLIVYDTRGNCGKAGITFRVAEDLEATETAWIGKDNNTLWRADDSIEIHGEYVGTLTPNQLSVSFNNPRGVNESGNPVVQKVVGDGKWSIKFTNAFTAGNPSFGRSFSQQVFITIFGDRMPFTLWQLLTNIPAINRVGFQWLDEEKLPINLNAWITANEVPEDETHLLSTAGVLEIGGGVPPYSIEITNIPAEFDARLDSGRVTFTYYQLMDLSNQTDSKRTFSAYENIEVNEESTAPKEIVDLLQRPLNTTFARGVAIYTEPEIEDRQREDRRLTLKLTDNSPEKITLQRSINYRYRDGVPEDITLLPEVDLGFDCGGLDFGEDYEVHFVINLPDGSTSRVDVERVDLRPYGFGDDRIVIRLYEAEHTTQLYHVNWTIPRGQVPYDLKVELCNVIVTNNQVCNDPRYRQSPLVLISNDITPDADDETKDVVNVFFQTKVDFRTNTIERYWQQCIRITLQDSCYITNKKVLDIPIFVEHQPRASVGCSPIVVEEQLNVNQHRLLTTQTKLDFGYRFGQASTKIITIKTGGTFKSDILCNDDNIFNIRSGGNRATRGNPNTRERLTIVADNVPARKNNTGFLERVNAVLIVYSDCWFEKIPLQANKITDGRACFGIPDLNIGAGGQQVDGGSFCNDLDPVPTYTGITAQLNTSAADDYDFNVVVQPNFTTTFPYNVRVEGGYNNASTLERGSTTGVKVLNNTPRGKIRLPENEDTENDVTTKVILNYSDTNTTKQEITLSIIQPRSGRPPCAVVVSPATVAEIPASGRSELTIRLTPSRPLENVSFTRDTSTPSPWVKILSRVGNIWRLSIDANPGGTKRRALFFVAIGCSDEVTEYVITQAANTTGDFNLRFKGYTGGAVVAPEDPCTTDRSIGGTARAPRLNFPLTTFSMPARSQIEGQTTIIDRVGFDITCPATIAETRANPNIIRERENAMTFTLDFAGQQGWGSVRKDPIRREAILEFNENRTLGTRSCTLTAEYVSPAGTSRDSIAINQGTEEKPTCKLIAMGTGSFGATSPRIPDVGGVAEFRYEIGNALNATASILDGYPEWITDIDLDPNDNTITATINYNIIFEERDGNFTLRVNNSLGFSDCIGNIRQDRRERIGPTSISCQDESGVIISCENSIVLKVISGSRGERIIDLTNAYFEDLEVTEVFPDPTNANWFTADIKRGLSDRTTPTDRRFVRVIAVSTERNFAQTNRNASIRLTDKASGDRLLATIPVIQEHDPDIDNYRIEFYNADRSVFRTRDIGPLASNGSEDFVLRFAVGYRNSQGQLDGVSNIDNLRIIDTVGWITVTAPVDSGAKTNATDLNPGIRPGTTIWEATIDPSFNGNVAEREGKVRFELLTAQGSQANLPNSEFTITQEGTPGALVFNVLSNRLRADGEDTFVTVAYTLNKGDNTNLSYSYDDDDDIVIRESASYSADGVGGVAGGEITFFLRANPTTSERRAIATVTATVGSESDFSVIRITQLAGTGRNVPNIVFDAIDLPVPEFNVEGGVYTVGYVLTHCVIADVDFDDIRGLGFNLSRDLTNITTTGDLTITASPQPAGNQPRRIATVRAVPETTAGGTGPTRTFTITQAPRGDVCPAPTIAQTSNNSPVLADGSVSVIIGINVSNVDGNRAPFSGETDRRVYITDVNSQVEDANGNIMGTSAFPTPDWFVTTPTINPVPTTQADKSSTNVVVLVRANDGARRNQSFFIRVTTDCGSARLEVTASQLGIPNPPCRIAFNNTANREISATGGELSEVIDVSSQGSTSVLSSSFVDSATGLAATWVSGLFRLDANNRNIAVATVLANDTGASRSATWGISTTNEGGTPCVTSKLITQIAEESEAPTIALTPDNVAISQWNLSSAGANSDISYVITNAEGHTPTFEINNPDQTLTGGRNLASDTSDVVAGISTATIPESSPFAVRARGYNFQFGEYIASITGTITTPDGADSDTTTFTWPARPNYENIPSIIASPVSVSLTAQNRSASVTITVVNALNADVTLNSSSLPSGLIIEPAQTIDLTASSTTYNISVAPNSNVAQGNYSVSFSVATNAGTDSLVFHIRLTQTISTMTIFTLADGSKAQTFNLSKWNPGTTFEDFTAFFDLENLNVDDITIEDFGDGTAFDTDGFLLRDFQVITVDRSVANESIRFGANGNNYSFISEQIIAADLSYQGETDITLNFRWPQRPNYTEAPTISARNLREFTEGLGGNFSLSVTNAVLGDCFIELTGFTDADGQTETPDASNVNLGMDLVGGKYYVQSNSRIESEARIFGVFSEAGEYEFLASVTNNLLARSVNFTIEVEPDLRGALTLDPDNTNTIKWDGFPNFNLGLRANRSGIRVANTGVQIFNSGGRSVANMLRNVKLKISVSGAEVDQTLDLSGDRLMTVPVIIFIQELNRFAENSPGTYSQSRRLMEFSSHPKSISGTNLSFTENEIYTIRMYKFNGGIISNSVTLTQSPRPGYTQAPTISLTPSIVFNDSLPANITINLENAIGGDITEIDESELTGGDPFYWASDESMATGTVNVTIRTDEGEAPVGEAVFTVTNNIGSGTATLTFQRGETAPKIEFTASTRDVGRTATTVSIPYSIENGQNSQVTISQGGGSVISSATKGTFDTTQQRGNITVVTNANTLSIERRQTLTLTLTTDEGSDTSTITLVQPGLGLTFTLSDGSKSETFYLSKWDPGTTVEDFTANFDLVGLDVDDITIDYFGDGEEFSGNYLLKDTHVEVASRDVANESIAFRASGSNYSFSSANTVSADLSHADETDITLNFRWPSRPDYSGDATISGTNTGTVRLNTGTTISTTVGNAVLGDVYYQLLQGNIINVEFGGSRNGQLRYVNASLRNQTTGNITIVFNNTGTYQLRAFVRNNTGNVAHHTYNFTVTTPPDPPTNVTATPGNESMRLTWTIGARSTGHEVAFTRNQTIGINVAGKLSGNENNDWLIHPGVGSSGNTTIRDLSNNVSYRFRIRCTNVVGASAWVEVSGTPNAPTRAFVYEDGTRARDFTLTKWDQGTTWANFPQGINRTGIDTADITVTRGSIADDLTANNRLATDGDLEVDWDNSRFRIQGNNYQFNSINKSITLGTSGFSNLTAKFIWPARPNYSANATVNVTPANDGNATINGATSFNVSVTNAVLGDVTIIRRAGPNDPTLGLEREGNNYFIERVDRNQTSANVTAVFDRAGTFVFSARVNTNRGSRTSFFEFSVS